MLYYDCGIYVLVWVVAFCSNTWLHVYYLKAKVIVNVVIVTIVYSLTVVSNISFSKWYQAEGIHGWDETYNSIKYWEREKERESK